MDEIPVPKDGGEEAEQKDLDYDQFDAIILSQSCDLSGKSVPYIHICPVDKMGDIFRDNATVFNTPKSKMKHVEALQEGRFTSQFITNKLTAYTVGKMKRGAPSTRFSDEFEKFKNDRLVINFHQAIVVSTEYFKKFAKSGVQYLALNPPYREAMAQKYGLFFMRVGNPVNYLPYNDNDY